MVPKSHEVGHEVTDTRLALLEQLYRAALDQQRPSKRLRRVANALLDLDASDLSLKRRKREVANADD